MRADGNRWQEVESSMTLMKRIVSSMWIVIKKLIILLFKHNNLVLHKGDTGFCLLKDCPTVNSEQKHNHLVLVVNHSSHHLFLANEDK